MKSLISGLKSGVALVFAAAVMGSATAQTIVDPPTPPTIAGHLAKAKEIAGDDAYLKQVATQGYWCQSPAHQAQTLAGEFKVMTPIGTQPLQVFDNMWMFGTIWDGVYILKTSAGLVLFDTLDNTHEIQTILIPGMKFFGLDPKDIKLAIITHGHGDHFGGAKYLQDTYHTTIALSEADWSMIPKVGTDGVEPPKKDKVVTDGEKIVMGDSTIQIVITPGHTPGTVSSIIPVKDHGVSRKMVLWGGTAYPDQPRGWRTAGEEKLGATAGYPGADGALSKMADSMEKLKNAGLAAGAEGIVTPHPGFFYTRERVAKSDYPSGPNPLVDKDQMTKTFDIMHECIAAEREWVAARQGS